MFTGAASQVLDPTQVARDVLNAYTAVEAARTLCGRCAQSREGHFASGVTIFSGRTEPVPLTEAVSPLPSAEEVPSPPRFSRTLSVSITQAFYTSFHP